MPRITIAGAGLAGTLLAIALARRGYEVDLHDRRPDPRRARVDGGRSINLALSARGSHALSQVGLLDRVLARAVPMRARAIHAVTGDVAYQAFGRTETEYLSAVERHTLNVVLLDAADEHPNIRTHFGSRVVNVDFETSTLSILHPGSGPIEEEKYERLIGADGTFSGVRSAMVERGLARFELGELEYGYKEFPITTENARSMRLECLHIWPRRSFVMIANPNPDASFSCTLFLPHEGEDSFASLRTPAEVEAFFQKFFPDALERMPDLATHYFSVQDSETLAGHKPRPTGTLPTVQGGPWHVGDKVLLLGDAAHALVPFFAQGMNSAFEDCTVLLECLDRFGERWDAVVPAFHEARRVDTDAIADMAMQNYREIQDFIADDRFLLRKRIEQEIMRRFPDLYTSMHVLVMFTRAPYAFAKKCGELQATLLDDICRDVARIEDVDWESVGRRLATYAEQTRIA